MSAYDQQGLAQASFCAQTPTSAVVLLLHICCCESAVSGLLHTSVMKARSCVLPLVLVLWSICCSPVSALLCYAGPVEFGNGRPSVIIEKNPVEDGACARYEGLPVPRCTKDDTSCKPAEIGNSKWVYAPVKKEACAYLEQLQVQLGRTRNVMCCTTDRCNAPDPKQDKLTKVIADAAFEPSQSPPP